MGRPIQAIVAKVALSSCRRRRKSSPKTEIGGLVGCLLRERSWHSEDRANWRAHQLRPFKWGTTPQTTECVFERTCTVHRAQTVAKCDLVPVAAATRSVIINTDEERDLRSSSAFIQRDADTVKLRWFNIHTNDYQHSKSYCCDGFV